MTPTGEWEADTYIAVVGPRTQHALVLRPGTRNTIRCPHLVRVWVAQVLAEDAPPHVPRVPRQVALAALPGGGTAGTRGATWDSAAPHDTCVSNTALPL